MSLYLFDFGIEFSNSVRSSFQSCPPKSEVVMYFMVYLKRLVNISVLQYSKYKTGLDKRVLYILLSNDRSGSNTLLNVVGVMFNLDFCDLYEFAARLHGLDKEYVNMIPRILSEKISTVSFCAVCQSITNMRIDWRLYRLIMISSWWSRIMFWAEVYLLRHEFSKISYVYHAESLKLCADPNYLRNVFKFVIMHDEIGKQCETKFWKHFTSSYSLSYWL